MNTVDTAEQIDMLKEGTTLVISADVFNGFMRLKSRMLHKANRRDVGGHHIPSQSSSIVCERPCPVTRRLNQSNVSAGGNHFPNGRLEVDHTRCFKWAWTRCPSTQGLIQADPDTLAALSRTLHSSAGNSPTASQLALHPLSQRRFALCI
jgi:hypothetical protein